MVGKDEYYKILARRIKDEMKRQKKIQKDICEKTGIKKANMSRYLNHSRHMPVYTLHKIADALGVSVGDLTGGIE